MAYRDKVSEKVQEAIFQELLSRSNNTKCADCNNTSPTWVSLDFGVFVCMRCSGVHRQLGPHITRVRSTRLDGWQKDHIEIMSAVGNNISNQFYENRMPTGYRKPGIHSSAEECRRFVDEKYIRKAFSPKGFPEPVKEYLQAKSQGEKPRFEFLKESSKQEVKSEPQQSQEVQQTYENSNKRIVRKKSMSLDKIPEKKPQQQEDLLSGDDDLLGGSNHQGEGNDFGEFTQASQSHNQVQPQSNSPLKKINFENFKKSHSTPSTNTTQSQAQNPWGWDFPGAQQAQPQTQTPNQTVNQNVGSQGTQDPAQTQKAENKVDVMKLYSQTTVHQNNFSQGGQWQGQGWNNGGNGFTGGNMQQNYYQNYPVYQNNLGGNQWNQGQSVQMGAGHAGIQNMGYGYNQGYGQFGQNYAQTQQHGVNKFF